jgi:hypothetical protein
MATEFTPACRAGQSKRDGPLLIAVPILLADRVEHFRRIRVRSLPDRSFVRMTRSGFSLQARSVRTCAWHVALRTFTHP